VGRFAFDGQESTPVVVEQDAFPAEFLEQI